MQECFYEINIKEMCNVTSYEITSGNRVPYPIQTEDFEWKCVILSHSNMKNQKQLHTIFLCSESHLIFYVPLYLQYHTKMWGEGVTSDLSKSIIAVVLPHYTLLDM